MEAFLIGFGLCWFVAWAITRGSIMRSVVLALLVGLAGRVSAQESVPPTAYAKINATVFSGVSGTGISTDSYWGNLVANGKPDKATTPWVADSGSADLTGTRGPMIGPYASSVANWSAGSQLSQAQPWFIPLTDFGDYWAGAIAVFRQPVSTGPAPGINGGGPQYPPWYYSETSVVRLKYTKGATYVTLTNDKEGTWNIYFSGNDSYDTPAYAQTSGIPPAYSPGLVFGGWPNINKFGIIPTQSLANATSVGVFLTGCYAAATQPATTAPASQPTSQPSNGNGSDTADAFLGFTDANGAQHDGIFKTLRDQAKTDVDSGKYEFLFKPAFTPAASASDVEVKFQTLCEHLGLGHDSDSSDAVRAVWSSVGIDGFVGFMAMLFSAVDKFYTSYPTLCAWLRATNAILFTYTLFSWTLAQWTSALGFRNKWAFLPPIFAGGVGHGLGLAGQAPAGTPGFLDSGDVGTEGGAYRDARGSVRDIPDSDIPY